MAGTVASPRRQQHQTRASPKVNVIENVYAKVSECDTTDCKRINTLKKAAAGAGSAVAAPLKWAENDEETQQFVFFDMEDST